MEPLKQEIGLCRQRSDPLSAVLPVALFSWSPSVQVHATDHEIPWSFFSSAKSRISISMRGHWPYGPGLLGCSESEIEMRLGYRLGSILPVSQVSPWILVFSLPLYKELDVVWQEDDLGHNAHEFQVILKWWDKFLGRPVKENYRLDLLGVAPKYTALKVLRAD